MHYGCQDIKVSISAGLFFVYKESCTEAELEICQRVDNLWLMLLEVQSL